MQGFDFFPNRIKFYPNFTKFTQIQGWKSIVKNIRDESIFDKRKEENNAINYQPVVYAITIDLKSRKKSTEKL